jgi:hypothetical protein
VLAHECVVKKGGMTGGGRLYLRSTVMAPGAIIVTVPRVYAGW